MEVFVARQPILTKSRQIYGYELLFRDGISDVFSEIDGSTATSSVLSNSFFSIGIESLTGNKKAFVNFSEELLVKKIPMLFPREKITVEILENVKQHPEVIGACRELDRNGYEIALDDFSCQSDIDQLVDLAKIIKIDFRSTPIEDIPKLREEIGFPHVKLLAEKVETYKEFQFALDMGFEYFQGFFFRRPEVFKGKDVSPSKLNLLQLMGEINKKDFVFEELEKTILRDVSLSYKILRYINSAYFKRIHEISSIKQAIILLGQREVKRFISLLAMSNLASDKPVELIRSSIIRARFCELLGDDGNTRVNGAELFTLGLFSNIDAILDDHMENIIGPLPLTQRIKNALIERKGELSDFLDLIRSYEEGEWQCVTETVEKMGLAKANISKFYIDAVGWADSYPLI